MYSLNFNLTNCSLNCNLTSNLDIVLYKRIIKRLNYHWVSNLTFSVQLISPDSYIAMSIISPQHPQ